MTRPSSRFLAAVAVVGAAIVASLVGGVSTGHASTSFSVVLSPLIGTSTNGVPQVSYGGKIGYQLVVQNTDTSNTTHVQVVVDVPSATFYDANDPNCAAATGNPSEMICIPPGGTMSAFSTYTVSFRFTAPTIGVSVTASPSVSIAAQTQGGKQNGNNGTTVATGNPVIVDLNADGSSTNDTYLRHNENASAGGPQNFSTQLPGTLLGNLFGLALGIHNQTGTICPTCIGVFTELTIPAASLVGPGTPFGTTNPYSWTMSATTAPSFKLLGVFHIDDNGAGMDTPIPACASGGGPTTSFPVCYDTLTSKNKAGVQTLTATGWGLENGKVGFG